MKLHGQALIFDIESNGLLMAKGDVPPMDRVHCLATINVLTGEERDWDPTNLEDGLRYLMDADFLIGHNVVNFDIKAIHKVYPWFKLKPSCIVLDTLILAKMIWPVDVLLPLDMKLYKQGKLPGNLIKRHSLKAWGYRLGEELKSEYTGGWASWNPEMQTYMVQDTRTNTPLWNKIEYRLGWSDKAKEDGVYEIPDLVVEIEHGIADIITDQELVGVGFDMAKATALLQTLQNQQAVLVEKLKDIFGEWWEPLDDIKKGRTPPRARAVKRPEFPDVTVRRFSEKTGKELKPYVGPPLEYYEPDAPYVRIKRTTFNPSSRKHLGERLQSVFGWTPKLYTENGQAQVDEGVIKNIPSQIITEEVRQTILEYFVITKTLGQLSGSKKSWLENVDPVDSRIHGRCDPLGTITTRSAHSNPTMGQVPSVEVDEDKKPILGVAGGFGWECRDLIVPRTGWALSGTDMSSLEFIMLGHDLHPLDDGVFSERVSDPHRDPHQEHSDLTGLNRKQTKNVGYAYIFGAGDIKIGTMIGVADHEIPELLTFKGLKGKLNFRKKIEGDSYKEPSDREKATIAKGAIVKKKFEDAITGLKFLKDDMTATAKGRGWIKSIAGHKLIARKPHAALNTRLQGGGAAACKLWIILMRMFLTNGKVGLLNLPTIEEFIRGMSCEGLKLGEDFNQVLWVHDETQTEHKKGLGPTIKRVSNDSARLTGQLLKLRGTFRTDTKTGASWAWTH